jgi:hypothetical protein
MKRLKFLFKFNHAELKLWTFKFFFHQAQQISFDDKQKKIPQAKFSLKRKVSSHNLSNLMAALFNLKSLIERERKLAY